MSDIDQDELPHTGWFDSESDLPGFSSVDSTIDLGVNVSSPSANLPHVEAMYFGDSNAMSPAPNKGNSVGNVPPGETESCKGENFLDTPTHTPPQSKSTSPLLCHRDWVKGRGRGWDERGEKVLQYYKKNHTDLSYSKGCGRDFVLGSLYHTSLIKQTNLI